MSIFAYVGLPGSGKSYNAVKQTIIPGLRQGRVIVTNIPLNKDAIYEKFPLADIRDFPVQEIKAEPGKIFEYVTNGCVLVADELWELFPGGATVKNVPHEFKKLLAEHRHMLDEKGNSINIVFVTQDLSQISHFARILVEQTFVHTKLSHLGSDKTYRVKIFHGAHTGQNPPESAKLNMSIERYSADVYKLYKSHTASNATGSDINEKGIDGRGNIFKRPGLIAAAVACLGVLWWAVTTIATFFEPEQPPQETKRKGAGALIERAQRAAGKGPITYGRGRWRVTGLIEGNDGVAFLESTDGRLISIDSRACSRTRFGVECMYDGEQVKMQPAPRAAAPIATLNPLEKKTAF